VAAYPVVEKEDASLDGEGGGGTSRTFLVNYGLFMIQAQVHDKLGREEANSFGFGKNW
jgi:hypothetical protein